MRNHLGRALQRPTGALWVPSDATASASWQHVLWIPELELYLGNASTGNSMTSRDGTTWGNDVVSSVSCTKAAWSPSLNRVVVIAFQGTNTFKTSSDCINWTIQTTPIDINANGITWAPALGLYVVVGTVGNNPVLTSPDGITWTQNSGPAIPGAWTDVCWSPNLNLLVAVDITSASCRLMTSPDGINWTIRAGAATLNTLYSVIWAAELSLFVATSGGGTARIMTSPNGTTWTARSGPSTSKTWTSVAWGAEVGLLAAISSTGTTLQVVTSPNGINWTTRNTPTSKSWNSIAYSPKLRQFVGLGGGNLQGPAHAITSVPLIVP